MEKLVFSAVSSAAANENSYKFNRFMFFFYDCSDLSYQAEGALTPAGWTPRGRLPSWCCGSDPSPPPCSPRTGLWWGCSWKPPAEPVEGRMTGRRWEGKESKEKEDGNRNKRVEVAGREDGVTMRERKNEEVFNTPFFLIFVLLCTVLKQTHSWLCCKQKRIQVKLELKD